MASQNLSTGARTDSGTQVPITYLDADDRVAAYIDAIAGTTELAVDTEGASSHRFVDRVYLLQMSTRDRHAVLDPLAVAPPPSLGAVLADPRVEVVFHDADYDLRLLRQDYSWRVGRLFDTRVAAQLLGLRQFGLAALLEREFGIRIDKRHQRADWSVRPLLDAMLSYAAQDTMYLLQLRDVLRERLAASGRLTWATEEFERLQQVEWAGDAGADAFLRIKGARELSRRELGLLRELVMWRDRTAAAMDRAVFRVMTNETLLKVARAAPTSTAELMRIEGVPRSLSSVRVAEVLAAVREGLAVPDEALPRFPRAARWERDPHFDARVAALRAVRDATAAKLDIEPGVLCPRERLETIARRVPTSLDELATTPNLRRWQVQVLGDELIGALRTRA